MIPVVELLRVSTAAQAEDDRAGLPAQHTTNVRTAAAYGLRIVETVNVVESGAEIARGPSMERLLAYVTSGRVQGIVVAEFSRLFRPAPAAEINEQTTLSEMKALTERLSGRAFREFASPHRGQAGGGFPLLRMARGNIATNGIIPFTGVKVP